MTLQTQIELFIYSLFIGIYLGVTYDLLYYFVLVHINKIVKCISDIIFFVCQAFIVFNVVFKINYGIIPLYCYFLFGIGFLIYYRFSQNYYNEKIYPLKKLTNELMKKLLKILKYIFIKPFIDTYNFIFVIYKFFEKKVIGCVKSVKKRFKNKRTKNID